MFIPAPPPISAHAKKNQNYAAVVSQTMVILHFKLTPGNFCSPPKRPADAGWERARTPAKPTIPAFIGCAGVVGEERRVGGGYGV